MKKVRLMFCSHGFGNIEMSAEISRNQMVFNGLTFNFDEMIPRNFLEMYTEHPSVSGKDQTLEQVQFETTIWVEDNPTDDGFVLGCVSVEVHEENELIRFSATVCKTEKDNVVDLRPRFSLEDMRLSTRASYFVQNQMKEWIESGEGIKLHFNE